MATFKEKLNNLLFSKHRRFACESDLIKESKKQMELTTISFNEIVNETRELTSSIIEKLEDQRKKTKALFGAFNASSDAIVIVDEDGFIVFVNDKFSKMYGYTTDEILGRNMSILKSNLTSREHYKTMWNTIRDNKYWEGIMVNRCKNGEEFTILSKILPIMNGKPEPIYYVCIQSKIKE